MVSGMHWVQMRTGLEVLPVGLPVWQGAKRLSFFGVFWVEKNHQVSHDFKDLHNLLLGHLGGLAPDRLFGEKIQPGGSSTFQFWPWIMKVFGMAI